MEEDGRIDVRTAVEIEDKFVFWAALRPFDGLRAQGPCCLLCVMLEDLHIKACRSMEFFLFGEEAPEIPRHPHGSTVFAAAMLQFLLHLLWRGIA